MAEGGMFDWKRQTVVEKPTADYSNLRQPLIVPKHMKWHQDPATREWSLVEKDANKMTTSTPISTPISTSALVEHVDTAIPVENMNDDKKDIQKIQNLNLNLKQNAVKGVDYLEHKVQPTDTFQGICLTYGITATKLRQTNMFSGTNLKLAPSTLLIPIISKEGQELDVYHIRKHQFDSKEGKVRAFLSEFFPSSFRESEAK